MSETQTHIHPETGELHETDLCEILACTFDDLKPEYVAEYLPKEARQEIDMSETQTHQDETAADCPSCGWFRGHHQGCRAAVDAQRKVTRENPIVAEREAIRHRLDGGYLHAPIVESIPITTGGHVPDWEPQWLIVFDSGVFGLRGFTVGWSGKVFRVLTISGPMPIESHREIAATGETSW